MNKEVQNELMDRAREACQAQLGLRFHFPEKPAGAARADALLELTLPDGRTHTACVEVRAQLRPWMVSDLRAIKATSLETGTCDAFMVVAPHVPTPLAERLREEKLWFMDAAGNVYLEVPERLLVFAVGRRLQKHPAPETGRISAEGAKVLFFLLAEGPEVQATYRDIAREVGVSLGLVSRVVTRLVRQGVIARRARGSYEVTDAPRLLERWCLAYEEELAPKLLLDRFRAPTGTDLAGLLDKLPAAGADRGPLVGGEFAGDLLTGYLRPASMSLHVPRDQAGSLRQRLKLAPSEEGNIALYELFSTQGAVRLSGGEIVTAHPVLVYAELLAIGDARVSQAALRLKEKHLPWIR